jgi:serine/threonine protein kinase
MDPKTHHNALDPSARLHWYEIRSILGQGGFGITYLAFDTNLKQQVAIKEYLPVEFSTRDSSHTVRAISENYSKIYSWGLQRFLEEAQTLAQFRHPNIVQVRTFFEHNNTGYIVMDYEDGLELEALIDEGTHFNEQRLLEIVLPILDGLAQIHKAGIIHRDIKPANIFIRNDQSPVLLDFGSARHAISKQTKTMTSLVTPGYAPFEQYHQAEGKQGPWTDIYSLGATCYCAITGKPPPDALKRGMVQFEHNLDVYLALADIKAGKYSEHMLEAIDCALRFRERDRPQSVTAWQQMLTGSKPVPAPENKAEQVKIIETPPRQNLDGKTTLEKAKDRAGSSIWSTLRSLILLGLMVAAGWYVYERQPVVERWIDAYIEDINDKQLATRAKELEARRKELLPQQALKNKLEQEAKTVELEQELLEQQRREQRKQDLQAGLATFEQESDQMAGQPQPSEVEKLLQEKERLADLARREAELRKREELARQEAERKLEEERQRLEQEQERWAQLQKQAQEAAQMQAEEQRQIELARQEAEQVRDAELAEQREKLARLEEDKRTQTELARKLVTEQEVAGLSIEAAIKQLREELDRQTGQRELVIDEAMLAEIVYQQIEKFRAEEVARLKAENLAVAKRLLRSAQEFYSNDRLEEALTDYRNTYDLNASPITRETAVQGIIDTMARLYSSGNSETWQLFTGNQSKNLSGEYVGNYKAKDILREDERLLTVSTMVAHKDNQLTIAALDLGIVVIASIEYGRGDLSFHDTKNDVHGTGTIATDSNDVLTGFEWSNADGSKTGSWQLQNQNTLWHIDLNGEYIAEITNAHGSVFRNKTFNFTLTDRTTPARAGYSNEIAGTSEDESIKLSGSKVGANRIKFEFVSGPHNIGGVGWFEISDVHGELIEGGWEIPGLVHNQSSGDWKLRKVQHK